MRSVLLSVVAVLGMALPAAAQDAVKVDPAHHKVEFENDQVRVLRVSLPAGEKTPVHEHPNGVVVFLNDSKNRVIPVGGKADDTPRKAGQVISLPAVKHVVENLGTTKADIIVVELKGKAAAALPAAAQDPVKVDPAHHKVEFENDQARVIRVTIPAGAKTLVHDHPNSVGVYLKDTRSRLSPVGGKVTETTRKAGDVMDLAAVKHVVENIGTSPAEVIMVELKGKLATK